MQIKDILTESTKSLTERIEADDKAGFLTEDLVSVVRADEGEWKQMPIDFEAYIDSIVAK